MNRIEPAPDDFAADRFAIISTQWNPAVVHALVQGAEQVLLQRGASDQQIDHYVVPGAFEIPLLAQTLARRGQHAAIIALGAVIKGDTAHFEYVAGECARGIAEVARDSQIPVGFGVLATYTLAQALERAGPNAENKGIEAATAVLDLLNLLRAPAAAESARP